MTELKLVTLNGGERNKETNAPIAEAFTQLTADATDSENREPAGILPLMSCLGITSLPYPPTKEGHAEGIAAENVGGLPGVCVAGWDTRCAAITANAKPGDTILHSTGPNKAAQVQCKEEKRQVCLLTQKKNKKHGMVLLDGDNEVFQVLFNGAIIQINKEGAVDLIPRNGKCGITLSGDTIHLRCATLNIGGMMPTFGLAQVPPIVGIPAVAIGTPFPCAPGINICK
jgi:hypothetical protein